MASSVGILSEPPQLNGWTFTRPIVTAIFNVTATQVAALSSRVPEIQLKGPVSERAQTFASCLAGRADRRRMNESKNMGHYAAASFVADMLAIVPAQYATSQVIEYDVLQSGLSAALYTLIGKIGKFEDHPLRLFLIQLSASCATNTLYSLAS